MFRGIWLWLWWSSGSVPPTHAVVAWAAPARACRWAAAGQAAARAANWAAPARSLQWSETEG